MFNIEKTIKMLEYNKNLLGRMSEHGDTWKANASTIACDEAIIVLKEKQELNKGCASCDGSWGDNTMAFKDEGYTHCPYCGRKLD